MRSVCKVIVFIAGVYLINCVLTYVLVPAQGTYAQMWKNYEAKENIDTIYVGNSVCAVDFKTEAIDEILGTNSANLGTDGQDLNQSFMAIKTATREHDIKTVVLGMEYITLQEANTGATTIAFQMGRNNGTKGIGKKIQGTLDYMTCSYLNNKSESVQILFPWTLYHVSFHVPDIVANVRTKLSGYKMEPAQEVASDIMDTQALYADSLFDESINNRSVYGYVELNPVCLKILNDIANYCEKRNIDLIVINTPRPSYDIETYGEEYYTNRDQLEQLLNEWGAEYYDFNFVTDKYFDTTNMEYYYDYEHLNSIGAKVFSEGFARFLQDRKLNDMTIYFKDRI